MNKLILALAVFAVIGSVAGTAVAGDQVLCLNASLLIGIFLSYIEHGLPDTDSLLAAPEVILDAAQC